jgi:hypothetical protein
MENARSIMSLYSWYPLPGTSATGIEFSAGLDDE